MIDKISNAPNLQQSKRILKIDGNLVLYSATQAIWSLGTHGLDAKYFAVQGDGNMVLYDNGGNPVWSSNTNGNTNARLTVQQDGNLVLYSSQGAIWSSDTRNL